MVQAFHQLISILQMALSVFRAANQFGGGQHLVPQQCHDLLFHWIKPFRVKDCQCFPEREFPSQQELEKGNGLNQYAVRGGLQVKVSE